MYVLIRGSGMFSVFIMEGLNIISMSLTLLQ